MTTQATGGTANAIPPDAKERGRERNGEVAAWTCGPTGRPDHGVTVAGCRVDQVAPPGGVLEPSPDDRPGWLRHG